jgi:hypothetical protein
LLITEAKIMDLTKSDIKVSWGGPLSHKTHLNTMFSSLQSSSTLVDVSLICQTGETVRCHKIVLAAASNLFKQLFVESTGKVRLSNDLLSMTHVQYSLSTQW